MGWLDLPGQLAVLSHPLVLAASGLMLATEFLADKLPWLDNLWDAVHTFIRIPAGAALVALAFGDDSGAMTAAMAILGGAVAAGAHFTKAGARGAINLSPEPISNWAASLVEDAAVPAGLWLAVAHPVAFLVLLLAGLTCALWLLGRILRGLVSVFSLKRPGRAGLR